MTEQPPQFRAGQRLFIERGIAAHKAKHPDWSSPCAVCGVMYRHKYARYPKTCGAKECIRQLRVRASVLGLAAQAKKRAAKAD